MMVLLLDLIAMHNPIEFLGLGIVPQMRMNSTVLINGKKFRRGKLLGSDEQSRIAIRLNNCILAERKVDKDKSYLCRQNPF